MTTASHPITWTAAYYDGRDGRSHSATLSITSQGLHVSLTDDTALVTWPFGTFDVVQGIYADQQVQLRHRTPPCAWLALDDRALLRALATTAPGSFPPPREKAWLAQRALVAFVGVAALGWVIYGKLLPMATEAIAPRVPVAWEQKLGEGALKFAVPPGYKVIESPRLKQEVDRVLDKLTASAPEGAPYRYRILLTDSPEINAYAIPGGTIVVHAGLLAAMASPEALAGVLAHEMVHLRQRHVTRALLDLCGLQMTTAALFGDTGFTTMALLAASLQHSREAELEADREGMKLVLAADIDPHGMLSAYEALRAAERAFPDYARVISTHPAIDERIAQLKELASHDHRRHARLKTELPWPLLTLGPHVDHEPRDPETFDFGLPSGVP